jgi:two-component SAPR family response regulator
MSEKKINVLLVDDDDLFLFLTERTLNKSACLENINSCGSVAEAQAYLENCEKGPSPFRDVIFVDMNMPLMTGMDFAEWYNEKYGLTHQDSRLVILTSSISRKEKVKAMEIPAVYDFMQKPLTPEKLNSLAFQ